jgi:GntR family transcriptional repressor for pyruvate dehydrogenase complex
LPSEHDLAEQYGVSRNVIREALKRLKEHGLVIIRTGSGTYVSQPTTEPVAQALRRLLRHTSEHYNITHFYEVRRMLEPESTYLAAERATEKDIARIRAALQSMERNREDSVAWTNADLDFHLAIASASHNPLVNSLLEPLTDSLRKVIAVGHIDPSGAEAGLLAHRQILKAIQDRAADRARQAMLDHLIDSQQRLSGLGFC